MSSGRAPGFRNDEITALLRAKLSQTDEVELEGSAALQSSCDVSYAIFLEPREEPDPEWGLGEWLVDEAIRKFSPSPVLAHCEIVTPPIPHSAGGRVHFATYLGCGGADWQNMRSKEDGISFYLIENGSRWRAVPVFGPNAAANVREAAQSNLHAPYSLAMYPTSASPLRSFAGMWSDQPGHKGHCAVITARVLKQAGVGSTLRHPSAWYSPSSLYNELSSTAAAPLADAERQLLTSVTPVKCASTIDTLLHAPMSYSTVRGLGDSACVDAVRALTLKVCAAAEAGDPVASRIAQKQLGTALLRWVLLREDEMMPGDPIAEAATVTGAPTDGCVDSESPASNTTALVADEPVPELI
jgi:hypothetical protein